MLAKELRKRRKDIVCCGISEFISLIFASMIQSQKFSSVYLIPILCQPMIEMRVGEYRAMVEMKGKCACPSAG
jgi:hypothetical protein